MKFNSVQFSTMPNTAWVLSSFTRVGLYCCCLLTHGQGADPTLYSYSQYPICSLRANCWSTAQLLEASTTTYLGPSGGDRWCCDDSWVTVGGRYDPSWSCVTGDDDYDDDGLYTGCTLHRLQRLQDVADDTHITTKQLHWLPLSSRIQYKLCRLHRRLMALHHPTVWVKRIPPPVACGFLTFSTNGWVF